MLFQPAYGTNERGAKSLWLGGGVALIPVVFAIATWVATIKPGATSDDALHGRPIPSVIRIGYAVEPPFAYLDDKYRVTGHDPEMALAISRRLGVSRVEWKLIEFGSLIDALNSGQIDVIAAGMFITPERSRKVMFSAPTFMARPALLVRQGNPLRLHSYAEILANPAVTVAVIPGSVEELRLIALGISPQRLRRVPDALTGLLLVKSREADSLALSAPTIRWMARQNEDSGVEMADPFENSGSPRERPEQTGGFAFRKEDADLCNAWNRVLREFAGSGEHLKIVGRFGFTYQDARTEWADISESKNH